MNQNTQTSISTNLPDFLVAALDVEELERRLELSMMSMEALEGSADWELKGGAKCKTNPDSCEATVEAKKDW